MDENTLTREEFWTEFKDVLFSEERLEDAEQEINDIIDLVEPENGSALDIPCGIGRHSLELNRQGFEVTGVDATGEYIQDAREKDDSNEIEFIQEDMKEFRRENSFDLIVNGWNSFGYFDTREKDRQMMENLHTSLKNGGVLVMDLWSKELTAMNDRERQWTENNGIYNMEKIEVKDNWNKVETTWIKVEDGETVEYTWEQRLYSARELQILMEAAGFSSIDFYGNLQGDEYGEDAERLIVVAEK
jgi:SAM-dependent methyltransferase